MPSGLGVGPLGAMPLGVSFSSATDAPPAASTMRRWIDTATGNYVLNSETSAFEQMPAIRQRVILALGTERGSSTSNPTLGRRRPQIIGSRFEDEEKQFVRTALRQMTDVEGVIRIDRITVERGAIPNRWRTTVGYTEIGTNQYHEEQFG